MTASKEFATQIGALAVGSTAFALGDPSGGTLLATPITALAALGLTLKSGCAHKACSKAENKVLDLLAQHPEYLDEDIDRARIILANAPNLATLDPKEVATHIHGKDFETELARLLMAPLGIGADDHKVRTIIDTALVASIAVCKQDTEFRSALTLELVLETARKQGIEIGTLARVETKIDNMGDKLNAILAGQFVSLGDMRALATEFGAHDIDDQASLESFLRLKAEEYLALKSEVAAIDDGLKRLSKLKAAAQGAIDRVDLDEVELLLSRVQEVEKEEAAKTGELRANNALLRGEVNQAFDLLSDAADGFRIFDPVEPARRRHDYMQKLYHYGLRYRGQGLTVASRMISDALAICPKPTNPHVWAMCQNAAAVVFQEQGNRTEGQTGAQMLADAIAAYHAAMEVYTRAEHPENWAATQNNLGNALSHQGSRTDGQAGTRLQADAVTAYRAALEVRTRADHPVDWATTKNNLGNALRNQSARTDGPQGAQLLADAVTAYRAALEVYTRADHPVQWAMTQNNLAATLRRQGTHTDGRAGTKLLADAVTAYCAALEVSTHAEHPVDWAMTQNNIGIALQNQGMRTDGPQGAQLLADAVTAYRAALEVRTRTDHPVQWADTQENIAIALYLRAARPDAEDARGDLMDALAAVDGALEVYDPDNMSYHHTNATGRRDVIQSALAALPD
ncbi:MAG: hypothetical protein AAF214_00405 [Pseudomonadota bacterium]